MIVPVRDRLVIFHSEECVNDSLKLVGFIDKGDWHGGWLGRAGWQQNLTLKSSVVLVD